MTTVALDWEARRRAKQAPAERPVVVPLAVPPGYANAAMAREVDLVANAVEGTRNHVLNVAAFNLGQLIPGGYLAAEDVVTALTDAARTAGLEFTESVATIASGLRAGQQSPRQVPELEVGINVLEVDAATLTGKGVGVGALGDGEVSGHTPSGGGQADADPPTRTTWWPMPLVDRVAADAAEPGPTHLVRTDGVRLFYSAKVNALLGESESGKSWVMLHAIADALRGGERCAMLDFEDSPGSVGGRLRAMGVDEDALSLLDYANPSGTLDAAGWRDLGESLTTGYSVIGVDGVNAAMTLLGLDINSNTDATKFNRLFLRRLADTGACVITVDHLPKNVDNRGKGGIGAQAKRAMLDGACFTVEILSPFGKGQSGTLKLTVDKDRPGHVRGTSVGSKDAARVDITSTGDTVRIAVRPAPGGAAPDGPKRLTAYMEMASKVVEQAELPLSGRAISAVLQRRRDHVIKALEALVDEGYLVTHEGAKRALLHVSVRPYRQAEDPLSDVYRGPVVSVVPSGDSAVPGTAQVSGSGAPPPFGGPDHSTSESDRSVVP